MEAREIIASANQQNTELQNQNYRLLGKVQEAQAQLSEAHTLNNMFQHTFQAQAFEIYTATEMINNLHHHINFLLSYIAHIEHQSEQAMLACRQATEYYEREIAAGSWSGHQWSQEAAKLSSSARNLHHSAFANFEASNTSDEQKKDVIQKFMEIEHTISLKEIQKNSLKQALEDNRARLKKNTERNKGFTKTIADHKAEIVQLIADRTRLEDKIQKQEIIVTKSLAKMKEQVEITKEAKKEVATYKGHALATTHSLLSSLSRTNLEVAKEIVVQVFKLLKDLDSKKKATQAIHTINGYLERQSKAVEDYTTNVISSSAENQTPKEANPDKMKDFIDYVGGLQHSLEAKAAEKTNQLDV
ncbi:hypothetical protein COCC4DRAFT_73843 [Bipolaris maydis ATCC 48331]|uniref:Uncharacterized protein n=2 Tax=Cochliobolus heterostrophus TaxID=5016 RepID=M2SNB7_COCH5|nr:uncharacterized protein COCC4DRAFT_73843 [Bipolaris maydis ATCC 48331]EMD86815.1 hypothetical protein COCHEDRAFT_1207165 [Bipolaris maydis C5]ENI03202.1 hypothetical protein COCC4DRAFT_73843 [Bipolaris maydis ATCC 48331]KAJ6203622.1 hypothetical protein PSV09DRAFT_1207165 [Bipolaris maydis]